MHTVEKWMTRPAASISPDAAALEALERMVEGEFRHLPVVECDGRLVGVLSFNDLRAALHFRVTLAAAPSVSMDRFAALEHVVRDLMTSAPATARADEPLVDAAQRMAERRIGCLPVVDVKGTLVGILTETDALLAMVELSRSARG